MHVQAHEYLRAITEVHWASGSGEHKGNCVKEVHKEFLSQSQYNLELVSGK